VWLGEETGKAVKGIEEGEFTGRETVSGVDFGQRRGMTSGAHLAAREGGVRGYRFGAGCCWAVGSFWPWAGMVPGVQFHVFLFLSLFFFCFSYFFHRFCKNAPNQFKPLSEIL
jgi:hypothetical protein